MKLPLLLLALVLSLPGWCASAIPSHHASNTTNANHPLILWALLASLIAVIWWVVKTKSSLDKTLNEVIQDMAQYP